MGCFQSFLPCVPRKVSLAVHEHEHPLQHRLIHSPESSTSSSSPSPTKGRESPQKFEISHPYPLVPGYRHSPIPHRSITSSPTSRSSYKPSTRTIPLIMANNAELSRSPLGPIRVSSLPQTSLTGRSVTFRSDKIDNVTTSMDDTVVRPHTPSNPSNVLAQDEIQEASRVSWIEQPRSLSTSPTPYSPPTSFRSLVSHLPNSPLHTDGRSHDARRHNNGGRRSMVIEQEPVSGERGVKKLRKVLRVEGDWEVVRESEVRGTAINGRPDDFVGMDEEDSLEMTRR